MNEFEIYDVDNFVNEFSGRTIFSDTELKSVGNEMYNKGAWNCAENDIDSILNFLKKFIRYSYEDVCFKYGNLFNCVDKDNIYILKNYTDLIFGDDETFLLIDFDKRESIERLFKNGEEITYDGLVDGEFKIQCPKCNSYDVFKQDNYFIAYTGTSVYSGSTTVCRDCGYIT